MLIWGLLWAYNLAVISNNIGKLIGYFYVWSAPNSILTGAEVPLQTPLGSSIPALFETPNCEKGWGGREKGKLKGKTGTKGVYRGGEDIGVKEGKGLLSYSV